MTKFVINARHDRIEAKDGRKVLFSVALAGLAITAAEGILAAMDPEDTDPKATLEAAVAAAKARKASVVPDEYRYRYGADQNCGDKIAKRLTALVTTPDGVDLDKAREIARANGVEDRFDGWMVKGLNPGMVRMNLGNVLRGMARRDEEVTL